MGVRLSRAILKTNRINKFDSVSAVSNFSGAMKQQETNLKTLKKKLEELKTLVSTLFPKIEKLEKQVSGQEQYSRASCLSIHVIQNAEKRGEYLDNERFICSDLNQKFTSNSPIHVSDMDIAHPLPSIKGDAR